MWTTHLLETTFNREGLYCKHGEIMVIFQFYLQNCSKGMADSSSSCDVVVIPPVNKPKLIMMIRCSSKPALHIRKWKTAMICAPCEWFIFILGAGRKMWLFLLLVEQHMRSHALLLSKMPSILEFVLSLVVLWFSILRGKSVVNTKRLFTQLLFAHWWELGISGPVNY